MMGVGIGLGVPRTTVLSGGGGGGGGGVGGGVDDLLLESTDHFLLESGATDVLIFE